ncbi:MAG: nuclear transport factor 2 family protein [Acetobacteraceae bacterium]|nr:nuclear transport factor 2 family protein [Acetobacteraceae bacterium]
MSIPDDMRLADRFQIEQAMLRYCRGVDRKEWDLVRAAYHSDAYDDHGNYKGDIPGFVQSVIDRHQTIEQSTHAISNMLIEFAGQDFAVVETYFHVNQRHAPGDAALYAAIVRGPMPTAEQALEVETVGRYVDHFTRRDGAWKIAHRTVVFELTRAQAAAPGGGLQKNWVTAQRNGTDRIQILRREIGLR